MRQLIAIDPGASGGLVFVDDKGKFGSFAMPDNETEIVELLRPGATLGSQAPKIYLEALVKYTGRNMPSSSMAVYAGNQGFVKGVAKAFGYTVIEVQPKAWQKAIGIVRPKKTKQDAWKRMLKAKAQEIFPKQHITLKTADAFLIMHAVVSGNLV